MTDISVQQVSKYFGPVHAVEDLTFEVPAGRVTGFLGPNGAGKTTTLRMLLGLVAATNGQVLIGGRRYQDLPCPRRVVGAVLEATGFHPGRRGRDHLRILAQVAGVPKSRVEEVLEQVELGADGERRVGGYSMGMRQRLGLAGALLGDPEVLILDEPGNGLDPSGMAWLRTMLQDFAARGRTVLVSSHVLSEVAQTVDQVVIISRGRLRFAGPMRELGEQRVTITTPEPARLRSVLRGRGYQVDVVDASTLEAHGAIAEEVGRVAAAEQIPLFGLHGGGESLERAFLRLTQDSTGNPAVRAALAGSPGEGAS
jgi:ABC-2 type transport system ATP-binding protein